MQAKQYRSNIISLQNHFHSAHAYRLILNVPQSLHQSSMTYQHELTFEFTIIVNS